MSLRFVLGRAGSGKSEYCIKLASQKEAEGRRVIMIVPEQYSHSGESAIIKEKGYICDDFNVTSFNRLAKKLIRDAGIKRSVFDSSGKAMLVLKAINNCKEKLVFYKNAKDKTGYIKLFSDAISEFKKGQVIPETLMSASNTAKEPLLSQRLYDLSLVLEEYNKLLNDDFCDSDDDLTLMSALCIDSDYIKNSVIFIDEFYRFTQNELSCIASLAINAEVYISLCMPQGRTPNIFKGVFETKERIERDARLNGTDVLASVVLEETHRFRTDELKCLEQALAGNGAVRYDEDVNDIHLHIAKDRYEEVMCAASKIRKLIAEYGFSYKDIAVIAGNYDAYADLIGIIFPMYEIPVFLDTRQDFLSHPIVLYLFAIFDLLEGITTKKVISYMKSGFADIDDDLSLRLENYALAGAIEYTDWQNDERFLRKAKSVFGNEEEIGEESSALKDAKNRMLSPIFSLKEEMMKSKNVRDRLLALSSFFEKTSLFEKIESRVMSFKESGLLRQAEEFSDVYKILEETMQTMADCLGEENMGLSQIKEVLEAGLSQKSIGVIPTVYDEVAFGDLNRSLIKNSKVLFVLGANDGSFPPMPSEDTLLTDNEREFLISKNISVAPASKKRILDAEFSVYTAPLCAREKLFVSYPIADDNGGGMRPAMFISKLKRTFPKLLAEHTLGEEDFSYESFIASGQSAYNYILANIKNLKSNKLAQNLYDELKKDERFSDKLKRAMAFSDYKNVSDNLSKGVVDRLYGKSLYGSVSRFERFSACPFSFFVEYGLKAKERKVLKIETPDMGSLLHEIIERFSKIIKDMGLSFRSVTEEKQQDITNAIIDEMFSTMFIKNIYSTKRIEALKKRLKSLVSKSIWAICEHIRRGKFEPTSFELSFDKNGDLPPVTVPLPSGGEITLIGRIDRIDTFSHDNKLYLKVIDYKSGKKGYSLSDIYNATTLQLAVYSFVAVEGIARKTGNETGFGGMFYFRLDDPVLDSAPNTKGDKNELLKTFKMSGLSSDEPDIIRAMDGEINGGSIVIPVYLKTDGTISKLRSNTAGAQEFNKLTKYIKNTVSKIGQEIIDGNVGIYPIRSKKFNPCSYCKYKAVCGFDASVSRCRKVKEFSSDEEIWNEM